MRTFIDYVYNLAEDGHYRDIQSIPDLDRRELTALYLEASGDQSDQINEFIDAGGTGRSPDGWDELRIGLLSYMKDGCVDALQDGVDGFLEALMMKLGKPMQTILDDAIAATETAHAIRQMDDPVRQHHATEALALAMANE